MARGRMLSKSLSTSAKIARLYEVCPKLAEWCRALFPLLVAHADDHGRLPGDELTVKLQVDPIAPRKVTDFVAALHVLHEVGLITWYQVEDRKVIEIVKFFEHQDLKGHDKRPAKLPPCPSPDHLIGRNRRAPVSPLESTMGELSPKVPQMGEFGELSKEKGREEKGTEGNLTQAGESARFDLFWSAYPKKVGKDAARKAFEKRAVGDDLLARILDAISQQKHSRDWTKDDGQFIPHPASWLNAARWEDEPATVLAPPLVSSAGQSTKAAAELVKAALRRQTHDA